MEYFRDYIHFEYFFCSLLFFITFLSNVSLLKKCYQTVKYDRFTSSVLINLVLWCFEAAIGFLMTLQCTLWYVEKKSAHMLFWIDTLYHSINISGSTCVTFLLYDRLFIVFWPMNYHQNRNRLTIMTIFGFLMAGFSMCSFIVFTELSTVNDLTECYSLACLSKQKYIPYVLIARLLVCLLNGILALILALLHLLKRYNCFSSKTQFSQANLIITIVVMELLLIFIPNLIFLICSKLGIEHWSKVGPYTIDFHGLNALLIAWIYRFAISSAVRNTAVVDSSFSNE